MFYNLIHKFSNRLSNKQFQTIFFKNFITVFTGTIVPLVFAVLIIYFYSYSQLFKEIDAANKRTLENVKATFDMIYLEAENVLLQNITSDAVIDLLTAPKQNYASYSFFKNANSIFKNLSLSLRRPLDKSISIYSGLNHYILSSLAGGQNASNYNDQNLLDTFSEYFNNHSDVASFTTVRRTSYQINGQSEQWVLTFYRTINIPNTKTPSFIAIDINLDILENYLMDSFSSKSGSMMIVNSDGKIIFDNSRQFLGEMIGSLFTKEAQKAEFLEKTEATETITSRNTSKLATWTSAKNVNWKYLQLVDLEEHLHTTNSLKKFLVATIIIGLLFVVLITYFVTVKLFRPIADILHIIENPKSYNKLDDQSGEIKYLLMNILTSFQKNITMEEDIAAKIVALRNVRARALQEQMTPHFLYNTLQAINWIAIEETKTDDSQTSQAIILLSEIVRTCMEQSDNFTTVAEEIKYVKKFMSLEQLRFGDGISCVYDVEPAVYNAKILRMSLQPLVENSISHGIQSHGCIGTIYICIKNVKQVQKNMLYICVEDDGVGMTTDEMSSINKLCEKEYIYANRHVGLVNLSQRIKLVFGEEYQTNLSQSSYGGLKIEINIPYNEIGLP